MDVYESKHLKFVPIGEGEHEEFLHGLLTEPGALNFDTSLPLGYTRSQVSTVTKTIASRKLLAMYILLRDVPSYKDPIPIGFVSLSKPEERHIQHGNTFLSLAIAKKCQGKGYGTEAAAWALDWAFDFARMHRVEIFCYGWNLGAKRLYERIGFCEEGVKREAVWFMGGWHDMHEMAILEHEWRGKWRGKAKAETWAPDDGQNYSSEQIAQKMGSA
ncbi:acyl-CoA N-acyltransferase [Xylaria cf. heliscus]|nr:acyl-CoA N-acyltransferase [Xylaria cf. heliscus]